MSIITFDTSADAAEALRADSLCREIGATLVQHYPNRHWYVDVTLQGGVAKVQCPALSMQYGFAIHINNKTHDQLKRDTVMAGGQILEMFNLSRERGAKGGEELLMRDSRGEVLQAASGL